MSDPISAVTPLAVQTEQIDYRRTDHLQKSGTGDEKQVREAKLRKATEDFESLFMFKLLKSMRSTVPKGKETGFGMETMRDITDEQLAVYLARQGGIGLGEMLYQSLKQRDEAAAGQNQTIPPVEPDSVAPAAAPQFGGETVRPVQRLTEAGPGSANRQAPRVNTDVEQ